MEPQQRSSEWFAARWGKITASRMHDVLTKTRNGYGASRKNYLSELVIQRLTEPPTEDDGYKNAAMTFGIDNEPVARLAYELQTGNEVEEAYFVEFSEDIGASPDGYVGGIGLIEIKCPNTATHLELLKTEKIPDQYFTQMQGQMMVTGREWCDFVSFDPRLPENAQLFIKRVDRDQKFIDNLRKELVDFVVELRKEVDFIKEYKSE